MCLKIKNAACRIWFATPGMGLGGGGKCYMFLISFFYIYFIYVVFCFTIILPSVDPTWGKYVYEPNLNLFKMTHIIFPLLYETQHMSH